MKKVACLVFNSMKHDSRVLKTATSLAKFGYYTEVIAHGEDGLLKKEIINNFILNRKSKSLGRIFNVVIFFINLFFVNITKFKKRQKIVISSLSIFPRVHAILWSKIFKINFIIDDNIKQYFLENKLTVGISNALDYLIDAAILLKQHTNILFIIVGNGGEKKNLERKCFDNDLKNVIFLNAVPKNQIQNVLSFFDLCYIGWHKNNLYKYGISANKIFDYMYSASAILHSCNAYNDSVQEANCGWTVNSGDVEAISNKILTISKYSKDYLNELGQNGKKYVFKIS